MLKIYYLRISDFQHLSEDELFPLVGEDTVRKVTGYKIPESGVQNYWVRG